MAALFVIVSLPALALGTGPCDTPAGYDEEEYQRMLAFMETTDENGVKNGQKVVAAYDGFYLPNDPAGWSYYWYDHENGGLYMYGIFFSDEEPRRVVGFCLDDMDLVGSLDASGFTELSEVYCANNRLTRMSFSGCTDMRVLLCPNSGIEALLIDGCTALEALDCSGNALTNLDASGCTALMDIECCDNALTSLVFAGCVQLRWLNCRNNLLTSLDLSACPELSFLECRGNRLTELDFSSNPGLPFDSITAEGAGFIAYTYMENGGPFLDEAAVAEPAPGSTFVGWYTPLGGFISDSPVLRTDETNAMELVARFEGGIPGDANGDGTVDLADALLVLRFALGIAELGNETVCDMNGDGAVDVQDALYILRRAMGLV